MTGVGVSQVGFWARHPISTLHLFPGTEFGAAWILFLPRLQSSSVAGVGVRALGAGTGPSCDSGGAQRYAAGKAPECLNKRASFS